MTAEDQLGYMTFEEWKTLDTEQRDFYLWRAIIGRCKECESKFEPRRGLAWKTAFWSMLCVAGMTGGAISQALGFGTAMKMGK